MPSKSMKICPIQGCFKIVKGGYCEEHKPEPFQKPEGYIRNPFYDSKAWRRTSKNHLDNNPLCVYCTQKGKVTPAKHTDHKTPIEQGGDPLGEDNLQGLCIKCHASKSAKERKGNEKP